MANTAAARAREQKVETRERLIRTICLRVQPLDQESFAPYGEIIGERGEIPVDLDGGALTVIAQTVEPRPLSFDFLGRHQRTEQVFVPLGGATSILAVAAPSAADSALPEIDRMAAFLLDGKQAVKLYRGTWYASAFPLGEQATFIVLDRQGTLEEDYDLRDLKTSLGIVVEIQP